MGIFFVSPLFLSLVEGKNTVCSDLDFNPVFFFCQLLKEIQVYDLQTQTYGLANQNTEQKAELLSFKVQSIVQNDYSLVVYSK